MADSTKEEQPTVPEQQIEAKTIKIIVKTPKEKQEFEVIPTITVLALKAKVSEKFKSSVEQLVLIFAGKILKDADTLDVHQIKEAHTVHLVIKSKPAQGSQTTSTPNPTPTSTTTTPTSTANPTPPAQTPPSFPFGGLGGMGGLEGLAGLGGMGGMGSGNLQEMQQRMQQELMSNPQALQQVMENPFVQSMMSNPDVMRQMISNNPQMQNLMERNPEITHMLNNPELMRQTMELARNPAMFQEMMRNQDRAMSNLESIPGGYNALRRLYTDVQEPMLNAAQEQFNPNPFASLVQNSGESQGSQNAENTSPLPNPWGGSGGTPPPTTTQTPTTTTPTTANQSHGTMFNTPAMQNLMQQITGNPEMMQSMMNAPYMQTMMQSLTNNPDLAAQLMSQNPAFANNPQLREMMPQILQQMQSPQMQALYSNPRAMEAMMQMQQAMQTLQQEAPGVMPNLMGPFGGATATGLNTSSTTPSTTTTTTQSSTNSATPPVIPPNVLSQMLQSLGTGGAPASTTPQVNPETRFQTQLEQLTSMGFFNREANLRALVVNNGNLSAAIDWLLSSHQS